MATAKKAEYKRFAKEEIEQMIKSLSYIEGYLVARSQSDSADIVKDIIKRLGGE